MLARNKLNSIENKISKALMDNEISHEEFEIPFVSSLENEDQRRSHSTYYLPNVEIKD